MYAYPHYPAYTSQRHRLRLASFNIKIYLKTVNDCNNHFETNGRRIDTKVKTKPLNIRSLTFKKGVHTINAIKFKKMYFI